MDGLRAAAVKKLADPKSAQYDKLRRATVPNVRGEPTDVSGYVNVKNHFGGYVGFKPFLYFVARQDFQYDPTDPIAVPAMLKTFCTGLL